MSNVLYQVSGHELRTHNSQDLLSLPGDAEELLFLQAVCVCVCCVVAAFLASQFSSHACSSIWQPEMPFFIYPASPVLVSRQSGEP